LQNPIFITGHKNPDTDSICAAIAYSEYKRKKGFNAIPVRLGEINRETQFVLKYFSVDVPIYKDNLKTQVSELAPYKEQIEAAQRLEQERQIAEKKESLKTLALKGGYITKEELETSETIKQLIENLDEKGIKAEIAERVIKKLDSEPATKVETSETHIESASANISDSDDDPVDKTSFMSARLNNKK
jgi:c-di-AMP phosphodiesterase-like protein